MFALLQRFLKMLAPLVPSFDDPVQDLKKDRRRKPMTLGLGTGDPEFSFNTYGKNKANLESWRGTEAWSELETLSSTCSWVAVKELN